jgi:NAD-dependent DNA ligase
MFVKKNLATIRARMGDTHGERGAVMKEVGRQWKALSKDERAIYKRAADRFNKKNSITATVATPKKVAKSKKSSTLKKIAKSKKPKTTKKSTPNERKRFLDSIRGSYSNYMEGHTVVLTGKLWDTRKNVEELLTSHGAVVTTSITATTSALIVGEFGARGKSAKVQEAYDKDIDIVPAEDLLAALS